MTETPTSASLGNLTSNDSFVVCCFFTDTYLDHAMSLKSSLDEFGLSYYFKRVEDAGYWEANTRIKPHFVLECLKKFVNKDVLYLDADAVVKKRLNYFNHIDADVAIYKSKGLPGMSHDYLTGTIFFKNTPATIQLVEQWIAEQLEGKRTQVDQDSFDDAIKKLELTLRIENLPLGYIKIFDKNYEGEVYIEQYQASRGQTKLKRQLIRKRNKAIIIGMIVVLAVGAIILL